MRQSSKAAIGGITCSLAIVIMLCTYISPFLVYTAPPFAGLLFILTINELGIKWSIGAYFTVSILSLFLIADKESAVFFTMFFGYYPILSSFVESKLNSRIIKKIIKFIIFNIAMIVSICICMFVLNVDYDDIFSDGTLFIILFVLMFYILFFVYDILVVRVDLLYKVKLCKKFRKLFNIK